MTDWFSTAVEIQREILRAQKAQADAAKTLADGGQDIEAVKAAGREVGEANRRAWSAWARFWGMGE